MNNIMGGHIYTDSPIGLLEIVSDGGALTRVYTCEKRVQAEIRDSVTTEAEKQLAEYFAGKRREFDLPIAPAGTDFQRAVWKALTEIPYGETRCYRDIAAAVEKPNASRAAGSAIGKNPLLIVVPCHRVIRSDGGLGGFAAGIEAKKILLEIEKN